MRSDTLFDTIRRNAVEIYSEEGLKTWLASGKSLKIKLGFAASFKWCLRD